MPALQAATRTGTDNAILTHSSQTETAPSSGQRSEAQPSEATSSTRLTETLQAQERLAARIDRDKRENKTGLIYMVLLGGAACLALTGVVRTAMVEPAAGPDAPAPAVFEQPAITE